MAEVQIGSSGRGEVVILAESHPVYTPFWRWYIRQSLRGHFHRVRLHLEAPDPGPTPTLWHGTHLSWWDGYLSLALAHHLGLEYRVMMLQENLSQYRFLRFAGAFGVARGNARGALESLRFAVNELQQLPARGLMMFPSGEIGSPFVRPIPYEPGVASLALRVAKRQPIHLRAVAFRLEHLGEAKPEALIRVSAPRVVTVGVSLAELTVSLREDLEREADALQADLVRGNLKGYAPMLSGSLSVQQTWDAFRRALGVKRR
jgi:1-acyl-sn-glycerol-3-phosphate acyltransferase